jgi:tetratricopeptide (TPR) repeat protein
MSVNQLFAQQHLIDSLKIEIDLHANSKEKVSTIIALADIYDMSDAEEGFRYTNEALELAKKIDYNEGIVQAYILLAKYYWKKSEYQPAFNYVTKAKEFSENNGFKSSYAEAILIIGNMYTEVGDYDENAQLLFQALEIFEVVNDKRGEAHALISIAASYFEQGNQEKALEYALKSLNISKVIKDLSGISRTYNNIGAIYGSLNDLEKEEFYYQESVRIAKELKWDIGLAITYLNLGDVNYKMSKIEESFRYFDRAYGFLKTSNNTNLLGQYHILRSRNFQFNNDLNQSIDEAKKALVIGEESDNKKVMLGALAMLHQLYKTKDDISEAYKYAIREHQTKDSIGLEFKSTELSLLDVKYQYEKTLQDINTKQKLREYNLFAIIGSVIAVLIFVILVLFFRQKIRAKNSALIKKQLELDIDRKNRELTSSTMSLLKTNEKISEIRTSLLEISEQATKPEIKSTLKKVATKINRSTKANAWDEFELRFKQIHRSFYNNLLEKYPKLTPNELRLCALLKLNLTTKEIAELTGQRVPSLETARSRLRKKLNLTNKATSLVVFLSKF